MRDLSEYLAECSDDASNEELLEAVQEWAQDCIDDDDGREESKVSAVLVDDLIPNLRRTIRAVRQAERMDMPDMSSRPHQSNRPTLRRQA